MMTANSSKGNYLVRLVAADAKALTHLPLDKMAAISQMTFSNASFMNEKFCILIEIWLKFVPKGPIDNNLALV